MTKKNHTEEFRRDAVELYREHLDHSAAVLPRRDRSGAPVRSRYDRASTWGYRAEGRGCGDRVVHTVKHCRHLRPQTRSPTSVAISDLAGESLILWGPPGDSFYADFLMSVCRRAGFEPPVTVNHIQGTAPTTAVIGTPHFAFVTAEPGHYHRKQTTVIAIEDPPMAPAQALWHRISATSPPARRSNPMNGDPPASEHRCA